MKKLTKNEFNMLAEHYSLTPDEYNRVYRCSVEGRPPEVVANELDVSPRTIKNSINKVFPPKLKSLTRDTFNYVIEDFSFSEKRKLQLYKILVEKKKIVDITDSTTEASNLSRAVNSVLTSISDELVPLTIMVPKGKIDEALEFEKELILEHKLKTAR